MSLHGKVLKQIVTSSVATKQITKVFINLISVIIRIHIVSVLSMIVYTKYELLNSILRIWISVTLVMYTGIFYKFAHTFYPELYNVTHYLLNEYSPQNFRKWKMILLLSLSVYALIILRILTLNNYVLTIQIIEYTVSFTIVDQIEQKTIYKIVKDLKSNPKRVIYTEVNIIDDFSPSPDISKESLTNSKEMIMIIENYN